MVVLLSLWISCFVFYSLTNFKFTETNNNNNMKFTTTQVVVSVLLTLSSSLLLLLTTTTMTMLQVDAFVIVPSHHHVEKSRHHGSSSLIIMRRKTNNKQPSSSSSSTAGITSRPPSSSAVVTAFPSSPSSLYKKSFLTASPSDDHNNNASNNLMAQQIGKGVVSTLFALAISFSNANLLGGGGATGGSGGPGVVQPAFAADGAAIGVCLLQKCRLPLLKCITNPACMANVICINTCNGKDDETGCQIKCGDIFENTVVGEFNKCAVSDMDCVPTRLDDGSYPIPSKDNIVSKFDTKLWNGRWYITAGQNQLFDIFPCQVHFFTETSPGKFYGKLNWRIIEPDGEYFTRDAIQEFYQDPNQPGHLINHDNEYLHYQDDWYIIDYEEDNNKDGIPPFAFVYYRGSNDAWVGYGGAVVYTRDNTLPTELIPRLRDAAKKIDFDFDKDFTLTDNTCTEQSDGERVMLREQFAGKAAIQTEKQLQAAAVRARGNAVNSVTNEVNEASLAIEKLELKANEFEKEIVQDVVAVEKELVKDVVTVEKEIVKDVVAVEKEIIKDATKVEEVIVKDVQEVEKDILGLFNNNRRK